MATQLPAPVGSPDVPRSNGRGSRVLVLLGVVGFVVLASVLGGWLYLRPAEHDTTGLEGTWCQPNNGKHIYEFERSGEFVCWFGRTKEWWNRLGKFGTWRRDGQEITIRTDRNWDFKGQLDGVTIRGKMLMKNPAGVVEQEIDMVLQKDAQR